jgi:phosphohistidine phosphatase
VDLYLMQHGVAAPESEDPARPLTAEGRAAVEKVVHRARAAGIRPAACVHSGKLRARQTAQILAEGLGVPRTQERAGLNPGDPVAPVVAWLAGAPHESLAVVGHLPFLERLASALVAGDERAHVVEFHNGGLVLLVPKDDGEGYCVDWALVPGLA